MKSRNKILIIGGLGFIGKNLYRRFKQLNYKTVHILSDVDIENSDPFIKEVDLNDIIIADIRNSEEITLVKNYDIIYCLAGISGASNSINDPYSDIEINLIGHLNVLEACRKYNPEALLIFPSSRLVYGKPQYIPVDEKHPVAPESIYAIHKLTAEHYYLLYNKIHKLKTIVFRISNPYGPYQLFGDKKYGVLNWFIFSALKGKEIEVFGHGSQLRDYIYIDDVVELLITCTGIPALYGDVFNIGSGEGITIHDAIEALKSIVPSLKYHYVKWPSIEKKIETGNYITNIDKISGITGWKPKTDLNDGLRKTVTYYKKHFSGI